MSEQNTPPKGLGPLVYSIELRDLFAMAALNRLIGLPTEQIDKHGGDVCRLSFAWADAMIAARKATRCADK